MKYPHALTQFACASALAAALCAPAFAARPMSVDNTNINDLGKGHVETWISHAPGSTVFNVAPAYEIRDNLELSGGVSSESPGGFRTTALQAKYVLTPADAAGCNYAVTGGMQFANQGAGRLPYAFGAATCNDGAYAYHVNLGINKPNKLNSQFTWGVAVERPFATRFGEITAHAEYFGQQAGKPTLQVGARKDLSKTIQLDATVGRYDNEFIMSVGMKFSF